MATGFRLLVIPTARPVLSKTLFFMSSCWPRTLHTPSSEESRNVRVWAWWDFKSCAVPGGFDAAKVAPAIMEAVRANGIKGPLSITAFGDVLQLPRYRQEALAYTGVRFTHVSNDERNSADIIVDLMYWVSQNPPPAHLFLISGDRDFAGILHRLRMSNYNILLATPERTPSVLCGAATIAWHWPSLLKGENLTGKHFNYPPDGPSGSWYGSCMVSQLEKPPAPCLPNVEVYEPSSGSVPKSLVRQIRHILSMHPKGIGITELRAELAKCDVQLDKSLFGHKNFSRFLLSLKRVQLRPVGDGSYCVHLVSSESAESFESSSVASNVSGVGNGDRGRAAAVKPNGDDKSEVRDAEETSLISTCLERSSDDDLKSFQPGPPQGRPNEEIVDGKSSSSVVVEGHVCQPPNELQKSSVANAQQSKTQQPPKDNKDSKTKMDSLQMTSQKSDNDIVKSEDASHKSMEKLITSENHPAGNVHKMVENNVIANYESGYFEAKNKYEKSSSSVVVEGHVCQPPNELQKSSVANAQQSKTQQPPKDNKDSKTKMDSLQMTSQKSDNDIVKSEDASHKSMEKLITSENHSAGNVHKMVENNVIANYESGYFEAKNKYEKSTGKEVDEVFHNPSSLPVDDSIVVQRPGGSAETNSRSPTFFSWFRSWWPFGKNNAKYDNLTAHQNKVVSEVEDSKLSELDQSVRQFEEPKSTELSQNVSHIEDSKLSELDQSVRQFEEPKSTELSQNVSHIEDSKLSELDQTVRQFEECELSEQNQNVSHSRKPKLFSSASFWNEMESFIFAPKASLLFSQSRSREDVVHRLQSGGPLVLRSLPKKDILHLVELLIIEKKWLEESPSRIFPFKLTQPVQKNSLMDQSHGANGLRSLFLSRTSQSNLQKSVEHDVEKHNQSISHSQASAPVTETIYIKRSRYDILGDCQKLVSEILREHPEGYNIGCFRRLFVDRYGYHLDIKKLGYQKLAALLQIMPGVKLESTYIFPSVTTVCDSDSETSTLKTQATTDSHAASNSDSELSESALKHANNESSWDELGPVSFNKSNMSDLEIKSSQKAIELDTSKSKHPDYEPVFSDDESSASEGESSCLSQSEEQRKPKCNEQNSSFWQAMDLWHSNKEGENSVKNSDKYDSLGVSLTGILDSSTELTKDTHSKIPSSNYRENSVKKPDNVESLDVSLADIFNSSTESTSSTLSKIPSPNKGEKQRSEKKYSFVADPVLPNKDKLVDGFKKTDESNMQN
ncbi:uncharacterized protein LOC109801017 isoform X2 [Cajanus cajan]|uniref:uncharacterized protein LOC109801017 isoform X2 n=1 Tax=Cajanus cajan TaxID=3821 RepID=UPI0010FAEBB3|nr:uncharacterized protein LOC109801017 isoform X2 [Cajanus cajan]